MGCLDGRVAIITGAARGQGEAEARKFVAEGAFVVMGDVLDEPGEAVAAELGGRAVYLHHDVTSPDDWARVVVAATKRGPLRALVNNAAIHWTAPLLEETPKSLHRIWEVNYLGSFLGIRSVAAPMAEAGGGAIVNISSVAGMVGIAHHAAYGGTKWAVRGLSKVAAIELGPLGIRVNSIHPGPIETAMLPADRHGRPELFDHVPLRRAGVADEVADLACYLVSDAASYQTGHEYIIDGGSTAGIPLRTA
ncbi:SDR family oxidoreductase [Candidatus Poriferisocius sp.]|uniref:SDR family oxidoreductase n=1 Tax=Candidatus Poriferisocius sp. TaxID=3101276 RepID=UPI003B019C38